MVQASSLGPKCPDLRQRLALLILQPQPKLEGSYERKSLQRPLSFRYAQAPGSILISLPAVP